MFKLAIFLTQQKHKLSCGKETTQWKEIRSILFGKSITNNLCTCKIITNHLPDLFTSNQNDILINIALSNQMT